MKTRLIVSPILVIALLLPASIASGAVAATGAKAIPLSPPANDAFANAVIIGSTPHSTTQDVSEATPNDPLELDPTDPQFPAGCGAASGGYGWRTVWYQYTGGTEPSLRVDTFDSDYDTILAVWTGSQPTLTSVACSDDDPFGLGGDDGAVEFAVSQGTTYYIEVAAFSAVDPANTMHLNLGNVLERIYLPVVLDN